MSDKLILLASPRAGQNAIAQWFLYQSDFNVYMTFDDKHTLQKELYYNHNDQYLLFPYINHDNSPYKKYVNDLKYANASIILTNEGSTITAVNNTIQEQNLKQFRKVLILRDFRNWMASLLIMNKDQKYCKVSYGNITLYEHHLKSTLHHPDWYVIKYHEWFLSRPKRQQICNDLELKFTDKNINRVSIHGNGSSFDGMRLDKKAQKMQTCTRYEQIQLTKYGNEYRDLLRKYSHIAQLSDQLVGHPHTFGK